MRYANVVDKQFRNWVLLLSFVLLLPIAYVFWQKSAASTINCEVAHITPRGVISGDDSVEPLWAVSGVHMIHFPQNTMIIAAEDRITIADTLCKRVLSFSSHDGALLWETDDILQPHNVSFDRGRNRLYVSAIDTVVALDMTTGDILWANGSAKFERNQHYVTVEEDGRVSVRAQETWYLDPDTGDLLEQATGEPPSFPAFNVTEFSENRPASDVVVFRDTATFLDSAARLITLDRESNEQLRVLQFEPPLVDSEESLLGSEVALSETKLAVYFQDTNQLSVYEWGTGNS